MAAINNLLGACFLKTTKNTNVNRTAVPLFFNKYFCFADYINENTQD